jgi:hypothetical protein
MFVSFLSLICHLFVCCLGLAYSSSYPCPMFFLPSHPYLCLFGCLSKSLLLCVFFLSLLGFPLRPRKTKRDLEPMLLGRVCIMVEREGEGFSCVLVVDSWWNYVLWRFYSLYGFVYLDSVVRNISYKFVMFNVVCTCVFS